MAMFADKNNLESYENQKFLQVVNEAYFGRTPGITRCFNAFCDFRDKYVSKTGNILRSVRYIDTDHDKDLHRFCKEMERQFGLFSFSFIINNNVISNMCTYPIMLGNNRLKGTPKDFIYVDKEGYHYKKEVEMNIIVCAYSSMLFDVKYTNEEMFSIVLHEVGHNFQQFLNNDMFTLNLVYQMMYIYCMLVRIINISSLQDIKFLLRNTIAIEPIHRKVGELYNKITSDESKNNLYSYFNFIRGILSLRNIPAYITLIPFAPALGIMSGISSIVSNILVLPISAYNYLGEQMADNFPTYYGFGKASITGEFKAGAPFGPAVEMVQKVPIIGHLYTLALIPAETLIYIGDCHPQTPTRVKAMMNSMKTDLNDPSLSPKLRNELKKSINDTEKIIDEYYNESTKIQNPKLFRELVDKYIYYNLDGGIKYQAHRSIFNVDKGVQDMTNQLRESAIINTKII